MSLPGDAAIVKRVRTIIGKALDDGTVSELSKRKIRDMLTEHFEMDVEPKKKFINETVSKQLEKLAEERVQAANQAKASSSRSSSPLKTAKGKKQTSAKGKHTTSDDEDEKDYASETSDGPDPSDTVDTSDLSDTVQEEDEDRFSELEDDTSISRPRKKSKPSAKTKSSPSSTSKPKKAGTSRNSTGGDEAEQRLIRLKKLVIECGVRKPWKKLYEAAHISETDFGEQCKVVQGVLKELGMTGKGSVEQARKIRAEREFADELAALQENQVIDDDVPGRPRRTRNSTGGTLKEGRRSQVIIDSDHESSESDFEELGMTKQNVPSKKSNKPTSAKRGASTHLQDSEDEGPTPKKSFKSSLASFVADLNSDSD